MNSNADILKANEEFLAKKISKNQAYEIIMTACPILNSEYKVLFDSMVACFSQLLKSYLLIALIMSIIL